MNEIHNKGHRKKKKTPLKKKEKKTIKMRKKIKEDKRRVHTPKYTPLGIPVTRPANFLLIMK
jgi:hypothetical protein